MNRFFRYGGIVASIILIAFGIGSIVRRPRRAQDGS